MDTETLLAEKPISSVEELLAPKVCPKSMVSKLFNERKKRKEEMFKRVIGQKDINNFFIKPKCDESPNPEDNFE